MVMWDLRCKGRLWAHYWAGRVTWPGSLFVSACRRYPGHDRETGLAGAPTAVRIFRNVQIPLGNPRGRSQAPKTALPSEGGSASAPDSRRPRPSRPSGGNLAPGMQRARPGLLGVRGGHRQEGGSVEASGQRGLRAICEFLTFLMT
ncbi:protein LLP homolog isoform X1 [Prionailurus viverrinus]|uniref:protein LLP homolog isoform X1 n=1 Tax=Prionailurus viverrinus TaxID=61388 RepID=UPI001FF245DD|nr:protein LLP homolog isoform X1 [Prionailurus viverrinus]